MNPDTLVEVIASRLEDFAERFNYLVSIGEFETAELIAEEGKIIADSHDRNDPFLVLCLPESYSA